jgi:hypothetical protein
MRRIGSIAIVGLLVVAASSAYGQTLQSETTWGADGAEFSGGVAVAPDGSSYLTGTSDSFAFDEFGSPEARIFLLKFEANGSLAWQRIWNGPSVHGKPAVAVGPDASVYVTGLSKSGDFDAVLLKFGPDGTLLWEREWGGPAQESGSGVGVGPDGSVYIGGQTTSFGSSGLFVVKFNAAGALQWQKFFDNVFGESITVAADGNVYAAATASRPGSELGEFDVLTLKIAPAGSLQWARRYAAGEVVDARAGIAAAPDSSAIAFAGAIQAPSGGGVTGISALLVKIDAAGNLVFDREWGGKSGSDGSGVAIAPNGVIYMSGTTTGFGGGFQDAFVVSVLANGKAGSAATWGGPGFEVGAGVAVTASGTVVLGAHTSVEPPYALQSAPRKVGSPKGSLIAAAGGLIDITGVATIMNAGATETNGATTFQGNFEAALVRFIF